MDQSFRGFLSAVSAFVDHAGSVDARFLLAALPLQVANLMLRAVAWRNLLAAAFPASIVRLRDVFGATTAGDAINVVAPVRVGDVATIALAHSRIEGANLPAITSSLVVFGAFDLIVSLAMYAWVYTLGVFPSLPALPRAPAVEWSLFASNWWSYIAVVALAVFGFLLLRAWVTRRLQGVWRRAEEGVAMLHHPGRYIRSVAFPQALAVVLRLGVVWFTLRAFHLPSTLRTAVIVTAVASITTIMPLTPNGVGARQAVLAYALRHTASAANVLTFSIGQQVFVSLVNGTIGLASLLLMVGTLRPSRLRRATRRAGSPASGRDT